MDPETVRACEEVAACIASRRMTTVMTGCGTSGRLAFLTARRWNAVLASLGHTGPPLFGYCLACTALPYVTLQYTTLPCVTLHYNALPHAPCQPGPLTWTPNLYA